MVVPAVAALSVEPGVAGIAQAHQVVRRVRTALVHRTDVMCQRSLGVFLLFQAQLAQGLALKLELPICAQVPLWYLSLCSGSRWY